MNGKTGFWKWLLNGIMKAPSWLTKNASKAWNEDDFIQCFKVMFGFLFGNISLVSIFTLSNYLLLIPTVVSFFVALHGYYNIQEKKLGVANCAD